MAKMYLYGGEQDGLDIPISESSLPKVFYVVPHEDQVKVEAAKGKQAKLEMRDKLAVLAYEYDEQRSDAEHFRMYRNPALDKTASV